MTFVTLDLAQITGWATPDKSGIKDFTQCADEPSMFTDFYAWLFDFLKDSDPSDMVIEQAWLGPTRESARLNGMSAIARMTAYQRGVKIIEVTTGTWRKKCFGVGNLKRKEAKARAIAHACSLGYPTDDDNEAEAICIREWYLRRDEKPDRVIKARPKFELPTGA